MKQIFTIICLTVTLLSAKNSAAQCSHYNYDIQITDTLVSPACAQNGQLNIGVSGGTAPYSFSWQVYAFNQVISTARNLTNAYAGLYLVTVTDKNGTCNQDNVNIPGAFEVRTTAAPDTTCPVHSGTASVLAIGGNIPYTYAWDNGATTATITGLTAGNHNVTVTDAAGCQVISNNNDSFAIYIYSNPVLNVTVNGQTPTNCADNNGTLVATASGGTGPYSYQWSSGYSFMPDSLWTTATLNNLSGGTNYQLTVFDANACAGYGSYYLDAYNPISISTTSTPQNCLVQNGSATVIANGTTGPYTYLWTTGSTAQSITSLSQGAYVVTVTDRNNCTNSAFVRVAYYSPIIANLTSTSQQCTDTLGTATVAPTLGASPYTYIWSNGSTAASISGLTSGFYEVIITDKAGCTVSNYIYVSLTSAIIANATTTDEVCDSTLGSVTLAPTGGIPPYTIFWSSGQTTAAVTGLRAGNYSFTITDAHNCQYSDFAFINYNSRLIAGAYAATLPMCNQANGSVGVYAAGNAPPFTFKWSNGATSDSVINLSAGYYLVTITDADNCSAVKETSLLAYSPLNATVNVTPASCIFTNDGSATVSISNGTPPYHYQWGNGDTTATADSLIASWGIGVYITDTNGCWADAFSNSVGYQSTSCAAVIQGLVVNDANANCIQDYGDGALQNAYVQCVPGYSVLTDVAGAYQLLVPPGNYALTQQAEYRNQGCPQGSIVLDNCTAGSTYTGNIFYDWPLDVRDLRVSIAGFEPPRPGFKHTIRVYYENDGLFTVTNAQVTFIYDAGVDYAGGADSLNLAAHTVFLNCPALAPSGGPGSSGFADLTFVTPASTSLGTLQTYTANITPVTDDATPPDNTETEQDTVVSSYDPNNLIVAPRGSGTPGYITTGDSVLKYTIHFQNTGNFQTSFVAIRDTLDASLDLSTVQAGASSVPFIMQLQNENTLVFFLGPIYLPDSAVDPINSIGMVSFYIKQLRGLTPGTQIHNSAGIYFDFNMPVQTNHTLNTLTDGGSGNQDTSAQINMQLSPNPVEGLTNLVLTLQQDFSGALVVCNLLGQKLLTQNLNLHRGVYNIPLNLDTEANGLYLVYVKDGKASKCLKLVKD